MAIKEFVEEFVEKFTRIENEKKLLAEEQRMLYDEYKERLDLKALRAAIKISKIKSRLGESEGEMENILDTIESRQDL